MSNRVGNAVRIAIGASALALTGLASAQDAADAAEADDQALEEVVVTGSRVLRNGNDSPTPLTVLSASELLQTSPSTVVQALQEMPVFAGGRNPTTQPGNSSQNNSARVLNLRNVGITRTLVLFDGRRVIPTSPLGEVNADFVPSMLLQRIDVVTGGASAVYGSDAVSGVVNFVTDRKYNGLKYELQGGRSELSDGDEVKFGVAGGMDLFSGRGHVMGSYEYFDSPGIFSKLDREFGQNTWTTQGAGTAANPYRLVRNTRLNQTSFLGLIRTGPLADRVFRENGVLSPFQHGTATGAGAVESGGDGGYFYNASLQSKYKSDLAYARFDYDISETTRFYVQANAMWSHNLNNHETNEFRNIRLSSRNAFLAPVYQNTMAANATFTFSKMMQQAPVKQSETYTDGYMAVAGMEGQLRDWKWDLSYARSESAQKTRNNANPNNQRAFAALDAVRDPVTQQIVCNVTLTHPGLYPGCVPLNLFGPTSESLEALNYVLDVTAFNAMNEMDNIGGTIAGSLFSLPAGEVQSAFTFEWRNLGYSLVSNAQPVPANCTGLRFNCVNTTLSWQSNVRGDRTPVSQEVKEVAAEFQIPLLANAGFAKDLSLNTAIRFTDYDTSGSVETWKVGLNWDLSDSIKLRGTRSRDIRAPNLNELFAPRLINPAGVTDIHTGIVGQAPFITDPNPNLTPESADTLSFGVVYRPEAIPSLSLSIDWYSIKIDNAITTIQGQNPTIQQICEDSNGTSSFCALIQRPLPFSDRTAANFVTAFFSRPENAQSLDTEGFDIEAAYSVDLAGGVFSTRMLASHTAEQSTVQFPRAPVLDDAGAPGLPDWRITTFMKYQYGDFAVDVRHRWNSSLWWNSNRSFVYAEDRLPDYSLTNLTFSYNRQKKMNFFLTVSNLFDEQPTPYGNVGGAAGVPGLFGGFLPGEDTVGRYFTIGLRHQL